ncbi:MAG: RDD family protein [Spongiibacteraceae bacterium]|jgi:uncharacterized RDD family membrane protein YckC|nr:RDD family protein [Spongiibacteraceae bacterium]
MVAQSDSPSSIPASALPIAGVARRLLAMVYDGFLLFGLLVVPLLILRAISGDGSLPADGVVHELPPIGPTWAVRTYVVVLTAGFYLYFWRRNGQTLGMQAWRLKLVSVTGERPGWRQCLLRIPAGALSLLCGGLGYFWLWYDRTGTWHDHLSNTRVVVEPKRRR